ncbi:MAG: hypothetical protein QG623_327 [Patescibacteria group bacterium]|nr:hypothetical protein [Patescibacteria group bacterium]
MSEKKVARIAVCSSASLYNELIALSREIDNTKIDLVLPDMAERMKNGSADSNEAKINWSEVGYGYKASLIRGHFSVIEECDAVLVTNFAKNGKENYIGGNVLMEMTVAFYLKKPIIILNSAPEYSPLIDEIMGMQPVFLEGDVSVLVEVARKLTR